MRTLLRLAIMLIAGAAIYKYRYRIVNYLLGQPEIRRTFISLSMRLPFIRDKFVQRAFS
ncbi:hypothetical protein [Metabacillus lacus]|uniref:hypothetical protein n=1 Tax=Metabacillus lacus TaxID=1983721 RepID=UPI001478BB74|nr:hypothetical protein [Metabacillus lacus]